MAESGRGQEAVPLLPGFLEERDALVASPFKNKFATSYRAVSISFYFQGQDFNIKYVLNYLFRLFHSIFYNTGLALYYMGLALTELGETCKKRGWLPISSLDECKASTEYIQIDYPSYVFINEEDARDYPKGCYVYTGRNPPEGYLNTHHSGDSHSRSRALCTRPEG